MQRYSSTVLAMGLSALFSVQAADFNLSSPTLAPGASMPERHVFNGFGCNGNNVSPALQWRNAPAATQSYAVTVYDPDAPTGSGWWHWVVYNLPTTATSLPEGAGETSSTALPKGTVQSRTDYGSAGYGGACPPAGDKPHRYVFTVHALNTTRIELPAEASAAMVGYMLNMHSLAKATLQVQYGR